MVSVDTPPQAPPPRGRAGRWRPLLRGLGEALITLGLVVLLFVFYEVQVTSWFSARQQADATERLRGQWREVSPDGQAPSPVPGRGFARLHIPSLGPDFPFTVLEGTDQDTLAAGPGHYGGTALPGQRGNFALAGHRSGRMAPFGDLDRLGSCDAMVVETATDWYVYRVLPLRGEAAEWNPETAPERCAGVAPIGGPYRDVFGRTIVEPERREVINPVPGVPRGTVPEQWRSRLITLTTCHPRFSAEKRMIVHGVLTKRYPKVAERPDLRPPELGG
ncbi:class E sortase [Actinopolyspora erythraea]|uniref:Sortase n=1 Tax=Actinopolyspora erythraea TaxID=414996 RepID=A0A099DBA2_9ACTN|nr:class E sortase [Actinopolyspora erythraea]ASU77000.1 class E sortase [Actinopolyspora erythraea]KGI83002.1 sortase [Actinopolyspora erythraea]